MKLDDLIELTADIVTAHVANDTVSTSEVPTLITKVHEALKTIVEQHLALPDESSAVPKVSVKRSITPDYLVCMVCRSKQVMLRRHLRTAHALTPPEYRERFGLARDYPMASPNYSAKRRDMAQAIGLGRKPEQPARKRLSISVRKPKG